MAEAMNRVIGDCPDLESIAAYLDNRLDAGARGRIEEHLASCSVCYQTFAESAHVLASPGPWRPTLADRVRQTAHRAAAFVASGVASAADAPMRWSLAGAVAAAAVLVFVVGTDRLVPGRRPSADLHALVAAVGTDRTIEGRLTGGFAYGPLRGPVRAGEAAAVAVAPDVRIAAAHSEKSLAALNTPEALHTLGVASLVVGDLDRAIPMLERSVAQPSPDPQFLTDLAAAYLARAARQNRHQDLDKALAAGDRAVKANPALPEALFNRALALDRLSLSEEARTAWQDYLGVDDSSGWADEARAHLQSLR